MLPPFWFPARFTQKTLLRKPMLKPSKPLKASLLLKPKPLPMLLLPLSPPLASLPLLKAKRLPLQKKSSCPAKATSF